MPNTIDDIAKRHGFSTAAVRAMAEALRRGGGRMAQFNHPDLGGMGQWSAGGMVMIGDMFNNDLKARVDALAKDLPLDRADPGGGRGACGADGAVVAGWPRDAVVERGRGTRCATRASRINGAWRCCGMAGCGLTTRASIGSPVSPSSRAAARL